MSFKNTKRFDLSEYLIHFFRNVDICSDDAPAVPESMGFSNIHEDTNWSAIFMLRCAIRTRRLWATWSYRGGVRTIYGRHPAVCFTEMPLAAFLEAGSARAAKGEAMSSYALVFKKKGMYNKGANPVIYGLDKRTAYIPSGREGKARVLDEGLLPLSEQYRYVTFNPSSSRPIDWTHEREWRWPCRDPRDSYEREMEEFGVVSEPADIPGLDLTSVHCREMGVIVQTEEEARWIVSDILYLVDRNVVNKWHFSFVLISDRLSPAELMKPASVSAAIFNAIVDLSPYFSMTLTQVEEINDRFDELVWAIEEAQSFIEPGEYGGVWLWILDNTSDLARALLKTGRLQVSKDGRYLASLYEFNDGRSRRQREAMVQSLAASVEKEFGVEGGYFSVLNSDAFDEVPFNNSDHIDNRFFYNVSW